MRTTLDIEDDVLAAAKELARREHRSAGAVISELARRSLTGPAAASATPAAAEAAPATVGGFRPFAPRGRLVTDEFVNALRDAEGV
jgi:hypothetical protein